MIRTGECDLDWLLNAAYNELAPLAPASYFTDSYAALTITTKPWRML